MSKQQTLDEYHEREKLQEALSGLNGGKDRALMEAIDAAIKSAVRAVLPGRQQKGNLAPYISTARKAFTRTLRRKVNAL
jgi:hypothetical protein